MTQPNEQLIARISQIRRNSEIVMVIAVTENTVHDLLGDVRFLLNVFDQAGEENKQLRAEKDYWAYVKSEEELALKEELQQTRGAVDHWTKATTHWQKRFEETSDSLIEKLAELEQVKAERDYRTKIMVSATSDNERLRQKIEAMEKQLSAKDKVLEWYGDENSWEEHEDPIVIIPARLDSGKRARSILSQFKGEPNERD